MRPPTCGELRLAALYPQANAPSERLLARLGCTPVPADDPLWQVAGPQETLVARSPHAPP